MRVKRLLELFSEDVFHSLYTRQVVGGYDFYKMHS